MEDLENYHFGLETKSEMLSEIFLAYQVCGQTSCSISAWPEDDGRFLNCSLGQILEAQEQHLNICRVVRLCSR